MIGHGKAEGKAGRSRGWVNRVSGIVALLLASALAGVGCGSDEQPQGKHEIWFMGAIYNGATGGAVTDYGIQLVYGSHTINGTVDAAGRFVVGPLPAWNDYGVVVTANGYRAFSSYNAGIAPPAPPATGTTSADVYTANTTQTKNFDAYLFPSDLAVPEATVSIVESGMNPMPASGQIRLQPNSAPNIQAQASGVPMQVWTNDQDVLASVVNASFTGGSYTIPAGTLVYGVTYAITIYGIEGFQPNTAGTLRAGIDSGVTLTVVPQTVTPLMLLSNTVSSCMINAMTTDTSAATITFTFNQPVQDGTTTAGGGAEVLDNGISIASSLGSTLAVNASPTVQERGTMFAISGNTLTISWNPSVGLSTKQSGDLITTLYYQSFGQIYIQPTGHPEQRALLSTLLGSSSATCF